MRSFARTAAALLLALLLPRVAGGAVQQIGRVAGRVVDAETGAPIASVRVFIPAPASGAVSGAESDLDGRFRFSAPAGTHTVRAMRIGFRPAQLASVRIVAGAVTEVALTMHPATVILTGVTVQAAPSRRTATDAGLLAARRAAPAVSDGISAEAIARTPDADAGDAVARIAGVSVVDNRFVVVRGLGERYSNTLLNGAELPSPEPLRRVVPLDIFPASLLEAIVTTKSATPDRPGDFAGGSVEIRTKEFPERRILQFGLSRSVNGQSTWRAVPLVRRTGFDWLGFDDGRRAMPAGAPRAGAMASERFAESVRNVWTPAAVRARPGLGGSVAYGDLRTLANQPLGYIVSLTYSAADEYTPRRSFFFVPNPDQEPRSGFVYRESQSVVDLGGVLNVSYRIGALAKLGWRNLYTRNAEESVIANDGFDTDRNGVIRGYQVRYVIRDLFQTQLTGEHLLERLGSTRIEWRSTLARARRDEPDNRQVQYVRPEGASEYALSGAYPATFWFRFLDDRIASGQLDVTVPLAVRRVADARIKVGGGLRAKRREFDARLFDVRVSPTAADVDEVLRLDPERAFAPEHLGSVLVMQSTGGTSQPYTASDDLSHAYLMIDAPVLSRVRLVTGVRLERWRLRLVEGAGAGEATPPTLRENDDWLWSANAAVTLSENTQLRLAGFASLARPDARELSRDSYSAVTGECSNQGNPDLERTRVLNGDLRWEWYPAPGEVAAVSVFAKSFDRPIVETIDNTNNCRSTYINARSAATRGIEVEFRRTLAFLPGALSRIGLGMNLTLVRSRVIIDSTFGRYDADLALAQQSPFVGNTSLTWSDTAARREITLTGNLFGDRIIRYGISSGQEQGPNVIERGRVQLDAKLRQRLGGRLSVSLAARNLTDEPIEFYQDTRRGRVTTGSYTTGVGLWLGVGYAY